jgi:hypothetical protein
MTVWINATIWHMAIVGNNCICWQFSLRRNAAQWRATGDDRCQLERVNDVGKRIKRAQYAIDFEFICETCGTWKNADERMTKGERAIRISLFC